jgi:tyrosinase
VGSVYTFSSSLELRDTATQCGNCLAQKKQGILSTAQVPITSALLSHARNPDIPALNSLEPEAVENYLVEHLTWRAVAVNFLIILPSFIISVN